MGKFFPLFPPPKIHLKSGGGKVEVVGVVGENGKILSHIPPPKIHLKSGGGKVKVVGGGGGKWESTQK